MSKELKLILWWIHPNDKEVIEFLKQRGAIIKPTQNGGHYLVARIDKEKYIELKKELIDRFGAEPYIGAEPYMTLHIRHRYKEIQRKEIIQQYKNSEVIILRYSVLDDRIIDGTDWDYKDLFKVLPNLKAVIDKVEDRWESGVDLWLVVYRDGKKEYVYGDTPYDIPSKIKQKFEIE